ncbi:hypothetical protein C0989_012036 [Termitomyces sp. Mn162]|nr:hypothetical protein C0989_012036 [Termitomyces sp. Mn162]
MYNSWSSINGQASSSYADYFDDQRNVGSRGNANSHVLRSQPSHPYVSNATQTIPIQPQVSGHQIHLGSDPHLIVKQTDQTLNALAFARRLSTEYIMHVHDTPAHQDFYDKLRKGQYYESYEGSSEPSDGLRPPQAPAVTVARQTPKGADGHACSYCGKAFSRPSALKSSKVAGMDIDFVVPVGDRLYENPSFIRERGPCSPARSHEAVEGIEKMALSFLSQLATFGRTSYIHASSGMKVHSGNSGTSEISTEDHRTRAKIEMQLADRSKRDTLG